MTTPPLSLPGALIVALALLSVGAAIMFPVAQRAGIRWLVRHLADRATAAEYALFVAILRRPDPCEAGGGECRCGDCGPFLASVKDWAPPAELAR